MGACVGGWRGGGDFYEKGMDTFWYTLLAYTTNMAFLNADSEFLISEQVIPYHGWISSRWRESESPYLFLKNINILPRTKKIDTQISMPSFLAEIITEIKVLNLTGLKKIFKIYPG